MKKGFTLIEVIIYIALFSILMGGAFITAYQLIDSSRKLSVKNTTQDEGNFVMRKLSWTLTSVNPAVATIPSSGTSPNLKVTKYDSNQIDVQQNGTKIEMKESLGPNIFLPITTDNVTIKASSLSFQYLPPSGTGPFGITANFIITNNGVDFPFTITKYIRK
jgi:prepilin-type N-terminal cleavage/methylation domain-containing protein